MARRVSTGRSRLDTRVGVGAVGLMGVTLLAALLITITVALSVVIIEFWPPECPGAAAAPGASPSPEATPAPSPPAAPPTSADVCPEGSAFVRTEYRAWGLMVNLNREQNLLVLVALLGALGAMGHLLRSFFRYVGERKLVWSWVPMYVMTPLVGTILAVLSYIILRAGLLGTTGGAVVGNVWGFAAIAALVGLFSAQAMAKLKQVFETLFSQAEQGADSIDTDVALAIAAFTPESVAVGDQLEIAGDGLENVRTVRFDGDVESPASYDDRNAVLRTVVPKGAVTGPVSVVVGKESVTSDEVLTIT